MPPTTVEQDLQAQIDELKSELRALRDEQTEPVQSSRRHLLKTIGVAAAGVVAGTVAAGSPAGAATGDELILGQENSADATTIMRGAGTATVLNPDGGSSTAQFSQIGRSSRAMMHFRSLPPKRQMTKFSVSVAV